MYDFPEQLRQAREAQGLSQEALAERLDLSRQSISKWELGASTPTPENLEALSQVLGVEFTPESDTLPENPEALSQVLDVEFTPEPDTPPEPPKPPLPWKTLALSAGLFLVLLSIVLCAYLFRASSPSPAVTGVYFFDETGAPLESQAGWYFLPPGETVIIALTFDPGTDPARSPSAAVLYLTPAGTETFEDRQQIALRSIGDGKSGLVLFTWQVPEDLMDHLEAVLECTDGQTYTEQYNISSYPPAP